MSETVAGWVLVAVVVGFGGSVAVSAWCLGALHSIAKRIDALEKRL